MMTVNLLVSFFETPEARTKAELIVAVSLTLLSIFPLPTVAADVKIFDDGTVAIWAYAHKIMEAPITLTHNGVLVDDPNTPSPDLFDAIEIYDRVPGISSWPLTWADLIGNCYFRATYQKSDGTTGTLGTSVVACPSYRTSDGHLQFIPTLSTADLETGLPSGNRIRDTLTAHFSSEANITSVRTYPDPAIKMTSASVSVGFNAIQPIQLDANQIGNDAFRFMTVSSMFASSIEYDATVLRWETPDGVVKTYRLTDSIPRGTHLLPAGTRLGCWFELLKESSSIWNPDSPTIRVEISNCENVSQQIGIQGFLANTTNPNDDSFTVWIEWLNVPNPIPANINSSLSFTVTAIPPNIKGDINNDEIVNVEDAILSLRVLAGFQPQEPINLLADVNDDGKIGMAEVIYIFQKTSGLRQ